VEVEVSGAHKNLHGKIPIVLGTIPLQSFQPPAPYSDAPQPDLSTLPTQPVSPASPPNGGGGGAMGWNVVDPATGGGAGGGLYPNIPPPTFAESTYKPSTISDQHDNEHTRIVGDINFSPRYPTFAMQPSAPQI